jgi:hypothetical protein
MNNFYDWELIMAPYVYSNKFVTRDGGIRDILKKIGSDQSKVLGKYEEFEEYLEELSR